MFRKDRQRKHGGGVMITVKVVIPGCPVNLDSNFKMLWVSPLTSYAVIVLGVWYRSPHKDLDFADEVRRTETTIQKKYDQASEVLLGCF